MVVYQGEKFKEYLTRRGISVAKAAKILDVSRQNVYQYFKSNNLSIETVKSLIDKLNVDIDEIFPSENLPNLNNLSDHNQENDMNDPQKRIYENYIEKLERENEQLRRELNEAKGVKAKNLAS